MPRFAIARRTKRNRAYRRVLYRDKRMEMTVMSVEGGIPAETHEKKTQFLRVESGRGKIRIGSKVHRLGPGDAAIVPAGERHVVVNTGKKPLKLYSVYAR